MPTYTHTSDFNRYHANAVIVATSRYGMEWAVRGEPRTWQQEFISRVAEEAELWWGMSRNKRGERSYYFFSALVIEFLEEGITVPAALCVVRNAGLWLRNMESESPIVSNNWSRLCDFGDPAFDFGGPVIGRVARVITGRLGGMANYFDSCSSVGAHHFKVNGEFCCVGNGRKHEGCIGIRRGYGPFISIANPVRPG